MNCLMIQQNKKSTQKQAFDEIKRRLIQLLLLHLPDNKGRFHLYSDTNKFATDTDTLEQDIKLDFEENSPYQEGVILRMYQRPDKSYFQEPPELQGLVNKGKLVQMFFTKTG